MVTFVCNVLMKAHANCSLGLLAKVAGVAISLFSKLQLKSTKLKCDASNLHWNDDAGRGAVAW